MLELISPVGAGGVPLAIPEYGPSNTGDKLQGPRFPGRRGPCQLHPLVGPPRSLLRHPLGNAFKQSAQTTVAWIRLERA